MLICGDITTKGISIMCFCCCASRSWTSCIRRSTFIFTYVMSNKRPFLHMASITLIQSRNVSLPCHFLPPSPSFSPRREIKWKNSIMRFNFAQFYSLSPNNKRVWLILLCGWNSKIKYTTAQLIRNKLFEWDESEMDWQIWVWAGNCSNLMLTMISGREKN